MVFHCFVVLEGAHCAPSSTKEKIDTALPQTKVNLTP